MADENNQNTAVSSQESLTFLALGGLEHVTRNMYLYQYKDQILIVDCGLGFPDETQLGVDLLLPDISYLLDMVKSGQKKIVGMVLTHGHEDHIGGLPFILPQLPEFPIYGSPLTAALSNAKLSEFKEQRRVEVVDFEDSERRLGDFTVSFVRITHSVPDSANIIIKSPTGNFFHGSDFKFDLTPADGKRSEFSKMMKIAEEGVVSLMSDCLGSDRIGFTPSEEALTQSFEREMRECKGKFIITTYSSNISRLNQAVQVADKLGRKVCFVGRSIVKTKQIGEQMGYLKIRGGMEIQMNEVQNFKPNQLLLLVAGSQGQENSAMTRIATGEHKEIKLDPQDVVVFSSDTIPGNEVNVNSLIDTISKRGAKAIYSDVTGDFHVSGHGSAGDHMLLIALTQPKFLTPISGTFRHMTAYRDLAQKMRYSRKNIFLIENGTEIIFTKDSARLGKRFEMKNVYVDQVSGEELENFVIRDRERLAKEGVLIILAEIKASDGQLASKPEVIARGSMLTNTGDLGEALRKDIEKTLSARNERMTNWGHTRRIIGEIAEKHLSRKFRSRPMVLPVVIEV